jgi:hypothetical protein
MMISLLLQVSMPVVVSEPVGLRFCWLFLGNGRFKSVFLVAAGGWLLRVSEVFVVLLQDEAPSAGPVCPVCLYALPLFLSLLAPLLRSPCRI